MEAEEQEDVDKEFETKQDYTILQEVPTFEYAATLCTLRKSQHYYDCVWKSHVRVIAPGKDLFTRGPASPRMPYGQ